MREYELVFIIDPDLEEESVNDILERVQDWVKSGDGQVAKVDQWGKRDLAYPIRNKKQGQYVLMDVSLDPANSSQIERNLRLLEPVMRFLLTRK
jgi:small subunit ribosomal protein S6